MCSEFRVKAFAYAVHNDPARPLSQIERSEEGQISPALPASLEVFLLQLLMTVGTRPQRHVGR